MINYDKTYILKFATEQECLDFEEKTKNEIRLNGTISKRSGEQFIIKITKFYETPTITNKVYITALNEIKKKYNLSFKIV